MIVVVLVDELEILDGGLVHPPIKVKHKSLNLCKRELHHSKMLTFVPFWGLVEEKHDVLNVVDLELLLDRVLILSTQ